MDYRHLSNTTREMNISHWSMNLEHQHDLLQNGRLKCKMGCSNGGGSGIGVLWVMCKQDDAPDPVSEHQQLINDAGALPHLVEQLMPSPTLLMRVAASRPVLGWKVASLPLLNCLNSLMQRCRELLQGTCAPYLSKTMKTKLRIQPSWYCTWWWYTSTTETSDNEDNVVDFIRVGGVQRLQDGEFIVQVFKTRNVK